ncbi:uncharacterized protein LOC142317613 [Lycorma delicatula]|uniref:uncharacterized protein LOC142317613 n=1 Tax=Lycorma delicatula TaxID=130591 RepID=UPI003F516308
MAIKYLGIWTDARLRFRIHVMKSCESREDDPCGCHLTSNTRGPGELRRRLLTSVVYFSLLYEEDIWADVLRYKRYMGILAALHRGCCLQILATYHTTSREAAEPIDRLIAQRRKRRELRMLPSSEKKRLIVANL